ncbi:unnamed protein product [Aphanomyces euteiches]
MFRIRADFDPTIGAVSHSEKTIGPYKILQPGSPSDVVATVNKDNSVTLIWNDNSNMESYYQIVRDGPDGSKSFTVKNTKDNIGLLSYTDKDTNSNDSIIYVYTLHTVIDEFNLPDSIKPGPVSILVKTKDLRPKVTDPIKDNSDIFKIKQPANAITDKYADKLSQYIIDSDYVAVKNIELNKKSLALKKGESQTLIATITPPNAVKQQVTWSSDNQKVGNVDSAGKVTGISAGTATIKAMTAEGLASICVVSITEDPKANVPAPTPTPAASMPGVTPVPTTSAIPKTEFTDIAGHWASEEIKQAVARGFVNGYPDGTFRPDNGVTRAEFTKMLMLGLNSTSEGAELTFKDKDIIGAWAIEPVSTAVQLGIIKGYTDGTFRPNANITHAEMISMVVRTSGIPMVSTQPTGYADDAEIPTWARPAAKTAELSGIIIVSGIAGKSFAPQAMSTRAEAASAIVKMLNARK